MLFLFFVGLCAAITQLPQFPVDLDDEEMRNYPQLAECLEAIDYSIAVTNFTLTISPNSNPDTIRDPDPIFDCTAAHPVGAPIYYDVLLDLPPGFVGIRRRMDYSEAQSEPTWACTMLSAFRRYKGV